MRSIDAGAAPTVRCPEADAVWMDALVSGLRDRATVAGSSGGGEPGIRTPVSDPVERARKLGAVGRRFLDPDDRVRRECLELLPRGSGLSAPMAEAVLDGMAADWTPERLERLLREEFGDPLPLGRFVRRRERSVMAVAPGLCVQLVAGSVPGVGVNALLRSLLLGAPTLLKPGLGDAVLPVLFARALAEEAPELADRLAVVYWPGGETANEDAALGRADTVVVYGSDHTVATLERRAPRKSRFVAYPHREGVGVVGRAALGTEASARGCAEDVARATAMFDQRGCVSPRVVYVEVPERDAEGSGRHAEGSETPQGPADFARLLAQAFSVLEGRLPSGALERLERSGIQQLRGTAEMLAAGSAGGPAEPWVGHGGAASWTVVYDPHLGLESNCVGRAVVVRPFRTLDELFGRLAPVGPHLQTVGVAGLGDRLVEVAESLGRLGASRVTSFATVPFPSPWWHHDGRGPLWDLVRWVDLERSGDEADGA
ncbi:MAG: acyl-CoA reductase [Gemmatimonadota bacterium]